MLNARDAPWAELERLRLMIPKRRSTTRKKGSPQARWTVKSPGPKSAISSSSLTELERGTDASLERTTDGGRSQWMERQGGQDRAVGTVGWKTGA